MCILPTKEKLHVVARFGPLTMLSRIGMIDPVAHNVPSSFPSRMEVADEAVSAQRAMLKQPPECFRSIFGRREEGPGESEGQEHLLFLHVEWVGSRTPTLVTGAVTALDTEEPVQVERILISTSKNVGR